MPAGFYQAEPPEITSNEFWMGPSAASFFTSAVELEALAAAIIGMLGGHAAVEAALAFNWPSPTGGIAVMSNVPHMLWLAAVAGLLSEAALGITATGENFELMRASTPTPGQVYENQTEHVALQAANVPAMGGLTPNIIANRMDYTRMWVTGVANKYSYASASAAGVQAIPPLPPPPPSALPAAGGAPASAGEAMASAGPEMMGGGPMSMMQSILPQMMQPFSQAGQMLSGGGGLQGLAQMPSQALSQLSSLSSQFGSMQPGGLEGVMAGNWVTATPLAGGPVSASLASVGGGGGSMMGMGSAALRSPASWSSTVNAAGPSAAGGETAQLVKAAEARPAGPVGSMTGMGGSGAMMGPMAHGAGGSSASDSEKRESTASADGAAVLAAAAAAFRSPDGVPTITGSGGAQWGAPAKEGAV